MKENNRYVGEGASKGRGTEDAYALYLDVVSYFMALNLSISAQTMVRN